MSPKPSTTCPQCAYTRRPQDQNPAWQCPSCGVAYTKAQRDKTRRKPYIANHIPVATRRLNTFFALILLTYGAYGLYRNDLFLPGKRSTGLHLQGNAAWLMFAAFVCASMVLLSVVLDHYDERHNEAGYQRAAQYLRWLGWGFFALSLLHHITQARW